MLTYLLALAIPKVKGQYVVDTGDFDAVANVHNLSLDTFTQDLTMPITGTVDGEIHVLGKNNQVTDPVGAVQGHSDWGPWCSVGIL